MRCSNRRSLVLHLILQIQFCDDFLNLMSVFMNVPWVFSLSWIMLLEFYGCVRWIKFDAVIILQRLSIHICLARDALQTVQSSEYYTNVSSWITVFLHQPVQYTVYSKVSRHNLILSITCSLFSWNKNKSHSAIREKVLKLSILRFRASAAVAHQ